MRHTNAVSSTLYLARLLEVSPQGRVVVECVTIHPDAGMPPTAEQDGGGACERRFLARLLIDAQEQTATTGEDDIEQRVRSSRRVHTIDIEFDDGFWSRHQDRWWVTEPVVADETLRDWLKGPSDGSPYQVIAFEADVDPDLVRGLDLRTFGSTAYW
jgi:hypothetical protein